VTLGGDMVLGLEGTKDPQVWGTGREKRAFKPMHFRTKFN